MPSNGQGCVEGLQEKRWWSFRKVPMIMVFWKAGGGYPSATRFEKKNSGSYGISRENTHIITQSLLGNLSWLGAVMKFLLPIPRFFQIISELPTPICCLLPFWQMPPERAENSPFQRDQPSTWPSHEEAFMQMTLKTHQPWSSHIYGVKRHLKPAALPQKRGSYERETALLDRGPGICHILSSFTQNTGKTPTYSASSNNSWFEASWAAL